ncbi:MAG: 2-isopropylmalate synthase [Halieaceae bacterium MED-G27]|nr:MAG: 2-isopropylmalate synthase [Halieaceae bacterium MED-G27]|tara:strand:- start:769 stop:2454 length:1686 start_codon:yes stop_codon:yes gene_type:complete
MTQDSSQGFDHSKYPSYKPIKKADRRWPDAVLTKAPQWCSVDLRDGNQALIEPMTSQKKLRLWELLVDLGFKQIEVGFPSASSHDFDFLRKLIEEKRIPDDVTVQVLTQAREELITKTFEALKGAKRAVLHFYNSTSTVQRDYVFGLDRDGITDIAVKGAQLVKQVAAQYPDTEWVFEYSPESFTGTEIDYAVEVCNAVVDVIKPTPEHPMIINLPATVEMSTPNVYADQIEWFCDHVDQRDALIISLHTHNDRGGAVAASELGILAGADRVEGTLLGNGERTGNMDIVTMAMNLYSQGIDPKLDFGQMDEMIAVCKECTQLPLHPRHPYAGELVFTAFSGSHQDAINKCLARRDDRDPWEVAYLPIDPADIGRSYQEVIRINSQSGKGGVAYVLKRDHGLDIPRWLQIDFSSAVQSLAEHSESEVVSDDIYQLFLNTYALDRSNVQVGRYQLAREETVDALQVDIVVGNTPTSITGRGNGVVAAFVDALGVYTGTKLVVVEYSEHTLGRDAEAEAICYVQVAIDGRRSCGVGRSQDIVQASMAAIVSAVSRASVFRDLAA